MTLGYVQRAMRLLEARIEGLEEITANALTGSERRDDADAAFSDKQVKWLKEFHEERDEIRAGRLFTRIVLWSAGSAIAGAASVLLAYLKLRN